jgi:hypothetical protein
MEEFLFMCVMSRQRSEFRGAMRRKRYIVQNGDERVVNKQDVVEYTETIRHYCSVLGMRIDGKEDTRTRVISPLQDPGEGM